MPATIRYATIADLPRIVEIYNAAIPGRMATADTAPVSVESRRGWFAEFNEATRPCWVAEKNGLVVGWHSMRSYYGRPAYQATVEAAVYVAPEFTHQGIGGALLDQGIESAPDCGIRTILALIFAHNEPSLSIFVRRNFQRWGYLPQVCEMDAKRYDVVILGRQI